MAGRLCCTNVAHILRIKCNSLVAAASHCVRRARSQVAHLPLAWLRLPARLSSAAQQQRSGLWSEGSYRWHARLMLRVTGITAGSTTSAIRDFSVDTTTAAVSAYAGLGRPSGRCGIAGSAYLTRLDFFSKTISSMRRQYASATFGSSEDSPLVTCISGPNSQSVVVR